MSWHLPGRQRDFLGITLRVTHRKSTRPRSDASVQLRSQKPRRLKMPVVHIPNPEYGAQSPDFRAAGGPVPVDLQSTLRCPEPALSLPKGPRFGDGDGSQVAHSSWYRELGTDPPICEPQTDGWIGERTRALSPHRQLERDSTMLALALPALPFTHL